MKNNTHLVLDLETLSTERNAVVISIGYALVKDATVVNFAEHRLDIAKQMEAGRHVSASTIQWWLTGDKAAAQQHINNLPVINVGVAMDSITNTLRAHGGEWKSVLVWGNSPNFDCDILGDLLRGVPGYDGKPWAFWNERDLRTLRAMHSAKRPVPHIPHSAMYDAMAEAEELCNYLRTL